MVEGECLVVAGFGLGWFAQLIQCVGEAEQAVGLVALCVGECLEEGECLVVAGFDLR